MNFTVYRSSAGSGKTFTLVREYLNLALGDPSDPPQRYREILAITFTNKAAAEMKERIVRALKELSILIDDRPGILASMLMKDLQIDRLTLQSRADAVLRAILHNYSDFAIGTIDSFTHRIVRSFAHDLDLPLNFEVETDADLLLRQAVDVLISRIGQDEQLTNVLVQFAQSNTDDDKSWQLETRIMSISKNLLSEESSRYVERLKELRIENFIAIGKKLRSWLSEFEKQVAALAKKAIDLLNDSGIEPFELANGKNGLGGRLLALANGETEKLGGAKTNIEKNIAAKKLFADKTLSAKKQKINSITDHLIELWNDLEDICEREFGNYILRKQLLRNIFPMSVLNEIEKIILEFRNEDNIIHISAFNRIISDVVFEQPVPFIFERLGEKYSNYLIDEFQDTSVVQWQNLLPLIDNALAGDHFTMLVGDGKQAIYRWRGGDVEQFSSLPTVTSFTDNELVVQRAKSLQRNFRALHLDSNFRSRKEIVEFNNIFFRKIASFLHDDHRKIYESLEQKSDPLNEGGLVHIELMYDEMSESDLRIEKTLALIGELREEGWRLEQIAILTRSNKEANSTAAELLRNGIPVLSTESLLLKNSPAVNFLVAALTCIDHPEDELPGVQMISFLHSVGKLSGTMDHLLSEYSSMEKNIRKFLDAKGFDLSSCLSAGNIFEQAELLFRIFSLNESEDMFLLFFLDEMLDYLQSRKANKMDFAEYWEERSKNASVLVPRGMNAVSIMTIHKAKGLEFPVVILPYADWKIERQKGEFWVELNDELIPELKTALIPSSAVLESTILATMYEEEKRRSVLDVMNELYVAMTRPMDRLYIFCSAKENKTNSSPTNVTQLIRAGASALEENFKENILTYGKGNVVAQVRHGKTDYTSSKKNFSGEWKNRLRMRAPSGEFWETKKREEKNDRGKMIHHLLAAINTAEDIPSAISSAIADGFITENEKQEFTDLLGKIAAHPELKILFGKNSRNKNERELLLPSGKKFRPDRVTLLEEKVIVLDYKTGAHDEKHKQQIDRYAELLKEMGYKNVEKKILYTEEMKVVSW
ncbi:MAG: UvrD-helicase domain-containing protein [Bacteroidetes bacterium]|nr:UvrD-helicase domain-containing protein [Bacteroidota bacterium]